MNSSNSKNALDVSIVIPMKNAEKYIVKTINNIFEQKNVVLEIIVVDD